MPADTSYHLGVGHLLLIFFFKLFAESLVILYHFLFLEIFPLEIDLLLKSLLSGLGLPLHVLLSGDIAHEHLRVQSLDLILVVVGLLPLI